MNAAPDGHPGDEGGGRAHGVEPAREAVLGEAVLGAAPTADGAGDSPGWPGGGRPAEVDEPDADAAAGWEIFRRVAMSCPVPVFAADAVGRHVFVNPRWSELTGVDPDEALGWGWERAVHPHDLLTVTDQWGRARAGGDGVWVRLRLLRPDGLHRAAVLQAVATTAGAGGTRFVGTLTPLPPVPAWPPGPTAARLGVKPGGPGGPTWGAEWTDLPTRAAGPERSALRQQSREPSGEQGPTVPVTLPRPRTGQEPALPPADRLGGADHDDTHGWGAGPGWDAVRAWPGADSQDRADRASPGRGDEPGDGGPAWWDDTAADGPPDPRRAGGVPGDDGPSAGPRAADPHSPDHTGGLGPVSLPPGPSGRERPRRDHLAWDGDRRRAAAPDGGDSWPGRVDPQAPPTMGGEWRSAIALHGRAADGHRVGEPDPRRGRLGGGHDNGHGGHARWAHGGGQGASHGTGGTGDGAGNGTGGEGHDGGHGPGDGGPGRFGRIPPAECGCLYGELARAEAACRDRERWLTSLLAELPAAVLLADAQSQVVGVNQAYCDLFDLAEAPVDLVGTDCRLLLRPRAGLVDDPAGFANRLDILLRRRRTLRREAVMFADGRVFERSHLPLVSPDGYRGHLWLYIDVTDRRILDAEIEGLISEL
ncbi:PAS domain-containing protein [Pseudofrankia sp. DC12]|uniref:PAS domain-containing protein n=1 Tax=Pseudofrankia sp. DC12 TaxID=683315 RepID=UPI0005F86155|nr:PAS domain-containing protein [Pseudofrankia sp. DC12]